MSKPSQRRDLNFENFDQMMAEVNRLHESGYDQKGQWNLAQTCLHLNEWLRYPMDGFPKPPIFLRPVFWVLKMTMARKWRQQILAGGFKPGMPTDPKTVYKPDATEEKMAIEQLAKTADRMVSHNGAYHASPLFGESDRKTTEMIQLLHCAHHLGFLHPT